MHQDDYVASKQKKWSDMEEDGEEDHKEITTATEVEADGSILKTIVEYKSNDKGQKIKVVKKVRVCKANVKINKRVEQRKRWKKFGDCAGLPLGPEAGVTSTSDEIVIEQKGKEDQKKDLSTGQPIAVTCRKCGGEHWTVKCPLKDKLDSMPMTTKELSAQLNQLTANGSTKYTPPGARVGADGGMARPPRDESATIRVTNLSEDTKESDISELFRVFGPIQRIYLAKDKISQLSKGFAFVSFVNRRDAGKAIEKLSGYGYDHLILRVEWAKPSTGAPGK